MVRENICIVHLYRVTMFFFCAAHDDDDGHHHKHTTFFLKYWTKASLSTSSEYIHTYKNILTMLHCYTSIHCMEWKVCTYNPSSLSHQVEKLIIIPLCFTVSWYMVFPFEHSHVMTLYSRFVHFCWIHRIHIAHRLKNIQESGFVHIIALFGPSLAIFLVFSSCKVNVNSEYFVSPFQPISNVLETKTMMLKHWACIYILVTLSYS